MTLVRTIALPSLRYLVHLKAPGWNVIGAGEPGLPGVAIGHNERVAWAFTIVGTDQSDLYVEKLNPDNPREYKVGDRWEPMQVIREQIAGTNGAEQDERRLKSVLSKRRSKSEEFFASASGQWDRLREDLFGDRFHLHALLALIDPDLTVGDLGCGTGQVSEMLASHVAKVVAVDGSTDMVQAARKRLKGLHHVEVRRGDMEGKAGTTLLLHNVKGTLADRVLLVGLGKEAEVSEKAFSTACASVWRELARSAAQDVVSLRARIGMVFQKPTPFPMSIYDNIAFGVKLFENLNASDMDDRVEWALSKAALWTEVKDKLGQSGLSLSGGQQQRLCIARSVAVKPSVLLLDEPTSALDPISTGKVEELVNELKSDYTIAIVTHNMQQAARVSDFTAYMYLGELIEFGETEQIFFKPTKTATEDYITGRFG